MRSRRDVRPQGFRLSQVKRDYSFVDDTFFPPFDPATDRDYGIAPQQMDAIVVSDHPYITRNQKLIVRNEGFTIYTAGTNNGDGTYTPTPGTEYQPYYLVSPVNAWPTVGEFLAANQRLPAEPPYDIVLGEKDLPQPGDPDYTGFVVISLYWAGASYIWPLDRIDTWKVTQHAQDIRI